MLFSIELPDYLQIKEVRIIMGVPKKGVLPHLVIQDELFQGIQYVPAPKVRKSPRKKESPSRDSRISRTLSPCGEVLEYTKGSGNPPPSTPAGVVRNMEIRRNPGFEGTPLSKPKPLKAVKCPACKEFKRECHCGIEGSE